MKLYLDASALVKRYIVEPGRDDLITAMGNASDWFMSRIGYVETARAIARADGRAILPVFREEWRRFNLIDTSQYLAEAATLLAARHQLKSLDAVHLASALILPSDDLAFATWDRQLHRAAQAEHLATVPNVL